MKKIILLLFTVLMFSCENANLSTYYWAELTADKTSGTTEDLFDIKVATNDLMAVLYCDNNILQWSEAVGYKFESGTHIVKVVTANNAIDSIEIIVTQFIPEPIVVVEPEPVIVKVEVKPELVPEPVITKEVESEPIEPVVIEEVKSDPEPEPIEYTTRFIVSNRNFHGDEGVETVVLLDYPMLTRDGVEFNLETMEPDIEKDHVKVHYTDTERLVYIFMETSWGTDSFLFNGDNMTVRFPFSIDELNIENMGILLDFIINGEPGPDFDEVRFNVMGRESEKLSLVILDDDSISIDRVETKFEDMPGTIVDRVKTINIVIKVRREDKFFFYNRNMERFFDFDFMGMTPEELALSVRILSMYENGDSMVRCLQNYNPDCEYAKELGII